MITAREIPITTGDIETIQLVRREIFSLFVQASHPWDRAHYDVMLRRLDNIIKKGEVK